MVRRELKVLIVGSGGREHALGWKLCQSPKVGQLYFAPGNAGTRNIGENIALTAEEPRKLTNWARKEKIDLMVIGPEKPLADGLANKAERAGILTFGPTKRAAQIEASKAFATSFMKRHNIPHPRSWVFRDFAKAKGFLSDLPREVEIVIKADGLAAGKGVVVPKSPREAQKALKDLMIKKIFGKAGQRVVIQRREYGPEVSLMAFSDGRQVIPIAPVQDFKRAYDSDLGPNTGGMGSYAPVPKSILTPETLESIVKNILEPAVRGLKQEDRIFKGVLYAGLMLTREGPKVLEFNARFGDPETQPVMLLLGSDLLEIMLSCVKGKLKPSQVKWSRGHAVCVVVASKGYPERPEVVRIPGLKKGGKAVLFHAGTWYADGELRGQGRVLGVCAKGQNLRQARYRVYRFLKSVKTGGRYRRDIAYGVAN